MIGRFASRLLTLALPWAPASAQTFGPPVPGSGSHSILWSLVAFAAVGGFAWYIFRSGNRCSACGRRHALEPTWEKNDDGDEQWRCRHCGDITWKSDPFRR